MEKNNVNNRLLNRFLKGEYSEEEYIHLNKLFCDTNEEHILEHNLRRQWYEFIETGEGTDQNLDNILYRIHYELNTSLSKSGNKWSFNHIIKWVARIAAIIILPVVVYTGINFPNISNKERKTWVEIKAPAWSKVQFSLPDGTNGWLNNISSLKYSGNFINDRKVILSGEAFFDVVRNDKLPFIVNAKEVSVKVLGTRFNIASYENEENVEVVLEKGKLIFNNERMNKPHTMNPNDRIVYNKTKQDFLTEVVMPEKYLSWTEGRLEFRNDPIDEVARRLGRWYNIDIEIKGKSDETRRLRATFKDENLEEVMYCLKQILAIDYKIVNGTLNNDNVYIKKKVIMILH
jgi:transmembrane sensor